MSQVPRHAVSQLNKWAFRWQANVEGEKVEDLREVGKLFQMTGPRNSSSQAFFFVLGTDNDLVPADHRCHLLAMVEIAKQSSAKCVGAKPCRVL